MENQVEQQKDRLILLEFYERQGIEAISFDKLVLVPESLIFKAANTNNFNWICSHMTEVSDEIIEYLCQSHVCSRESFSEFSVSFIGRDNK